MPKVLGYRHWIVECFLGDNNETIFRKILYRDNLQDIQTILDAMEKSNYMFDSYAIMLEPVYEEVKPVIFHSWDGNGSPV